MKRITYRSVLTLVVAGFVLAAAPNAIAAHRVGAPVASRAQASPTFVFPSSGQTFPLNGSMLFQVQPVSGAKGYLWSFVQGGAIMYQNLADEGRLSSTSYTIKPGSTAQRRMHPGDLRVSVRAQLALGQWTQAGVIMVRLQGQAQGSKPPASTPPQPSNSLYQANWSGGLNGWSGSSDWKTVNGMLINDGTARTHETNGTTLPIFAPYRPHSANYAVEAEMQFVSMGDQGSEDCKNPVIAIAVRANNQDGYLGGMDFPLGGCVGGNMAAIWNMNDIITHSRYPTGAALVSQNFSPGTDYHVYRIEARGNNIRLLIDGNVIATLTDNRYLSPGQIGLLADAVQVNIRSFKVIAL